MTSSARMAIGTRWVLLFRDHWGFIALWCYTGISLGFFCWATTRTALLTTFVESPQTGLLDASSRSSLLTWATALGVSGAGLGALYATKAWSQVLGARACEAVIAWSWAVVLLGPSFEYRHVALATGLILTCALATGRLVQAGATAVRASPPDITNRQAWTTVLLCVAVFVGVIGFLAHWRFITFHAQPYDMSWEINAVDGIVRQGVPRTSVGSGNYHGGKLLPAVYFDLHTPFVYYLYAPFYALFKDGRTLLWLQAIHMSGGAIGVFLIGRRWLSRRDLATVFALAYLLHAGVQGHCLHDFHANPLAIPSSLVAMGLMEAKRPRWALFFVFLTAITREETALYSGCVGLFWLLTGRSKSRILYGLIACAISVAVLLFITAWLMPRFGGQPRWSHFALYFGNAPGASTIIRALIVDPLAAIALLADANRQNLLLISLVPFGFLALLGLRASCFVLLPLTLVLASGNTGFFFPGINYSAPLVPAVVVMSLAGARTWLARGRRERRLNRAPRRLALGTFVLVSALMSNFLYGNIGSKTYKLEYGKSPYRRLAGYHFGDFVGVSDKLPAFGSHEKALWDLIEKVPPGEPISTSWSINPQLANRDVAVLYPDLAHGHPDANKPRYVVIDRLSPMILSSEEQERQLRADTTTWQVYYENTAGVIFERKAAISIGR